MFRDERLTYAELGDRTDRLARLLLAGGAAPEQVVAVVLHRSMESIVALLAVLKAGAVYLPVDADYPAERIAYMLAVAAPALVVTTTALADTGVAGLGKAVALDDPGTVEFC